MKRIFIIFLVLFAPAIATGEAMQEHVAMQISSTVSDGRYSLREIVAAARKQKVRIVILAERDSMKWEYGLWPFRGLFKKTVEDKSLLTYGVRRYLNELAQVQAENPDMLIIPGVESAPYYYWSGNPFSKKLVLHDWHRHLLTFGFKDAGDYENIPVVGNLRGQKYDQYGGDLGPVPYQHYVDYAVSRGAVTFWTHPEAQNTERISDVRVDTGTYADLLTRVDNYTGFFIFYEGYKEIGAPEGLWDEMLNDYCAGRRKKPVWAAAGLAVDREGLESNLKGLRTVVFLDSLTQDAVVEAMREGRMYVLSGKEAPEFVLEEFGLKEDSVPQVSIRCRFLHGRKEPFQIKLIRDAKVIEVVETDGPEVCVTYRDESAPAGKGYYRAEMNSRGVKVITNPLFYNRKKE